MTNNGTITSSSNSVTNQSVYLVVQRYRSCSILLEETEWITQGSSVSCTTNDIGNDDDTDNHRNHCGLLIYVSFASNITEAACIRAAETCLNLPILTTGVWGDETSKLYSIRQHIQQQGGVTTATAADVDGAMISSILSSTSITIVPQANLICKVKGGSATKATTASIQYHNQVHKEWGRYYYTLFVDTIFSNVYEWTIMALHQQQQKQQQTISLPPSYLEWKKKRFTHSTTTTTPSNDLSSNHTLFLPEIKFDPSILPEDIFRTNAAYTAVYESFDPISGIPATSTNVDGTMLTKSTIKKLRKIQDIHRTKHNKWKSQQQQQQQILINDNDSNTNTSPGSESSKVQQIAPNDVPDANVTFPLCDERNTAHHSHHPIVPSNLDSDETAVRELEASFATTAIKAATTTATTKVTEFKIEVSKEPSFPPAQPPTIDWKVLFQELIIHDSTSSSNNINSTDSSSSRNFCSSRPPVHPVPIVAGTFGRRQGISIHSDMGPFCHFVQQ